MVADVSASSVPSQPIQVAAVSPVTPAGSVAEPPEPLPAGWEIADYVGRGGRMLYAVFNDGRRMASGMTTPQSATRWARLMASALR